MTSPRRRFSDAPRGAFSLLEILVAVAILGILVVALSALNNQTLNVWRQASGRAETFQAARAAMDTLVRTLEVATLNPYWDYDNRANPSRYVRMSNLAFVCGPAADLLGTSYGPGSAVFFQAPLGRTEVDARSQLQLLLNTVGFFIEYRNVHSHLPASLQLSPRRRSCLMQVQTFANEMGVFADTNSANPDNSWFDDSALLTRSTVLAENVLFLVVRPLRRSGSATVDLTAAEFRLDTRLGETEITQPSTSNQLPPLVEVALVAASESSVRRISETDGYRIPSTLLINRFENPANLDVDLESLTADLSRKGLDVRTFRQTFVLPNSRWSE